MKKAGDFFEKYNLIFLILIGGVYLFTRIFCAGEIPYYIHIDELQEAYEALCTACYGTDSTGALPGVYFNGFTNGHSAFLIYMGALLIKLRSGSFSLKLFRLIPAFGGLFGLVFSYLFVWKQTGKKKNAFIAAVLVLSLPVFFVSERNFTEDFLCLSIIPAAFFFLLWGIREGKALLFLFSGLLFSLTMFSSQKTLLIIPVFLIFTVLYLIFTAKSGKACVAALCVPVIISLSVLCLSSGIKLDLSCAKLMANIPGIRKLFWDDGHDFNVIPGFGTIYFFSVPVIIPGIVVSLKKAADSFKNKTFEEYVPLWILLIVGLITGLLSSNPGTGVSCPVFFTITILIAEGIIWICDKVKGVLPAVICVYLLGLLVLCQSYFVNYNSELNHSKDHEEGILIDKSAGEALKAALKLFPGKKIAVCSGDFEGRNLLIALYGGASPSDYRDFCDKDSFSFGNIRVNPEEDTDLSGGSVYVIDQGTYPELIDAFTSGGWGIMPLKEYTVFYPQ